MKNVLLTVSERARCNVLFLMQQTRGASLTEKLLPRLQPCSVAVALGDTPQSRHAL